MLDIKLYEGQFLRLGAKLAMEHNLFVPGWRLRLEFMRIMNGDEDPCYRIALGFIGDEAVAVVLLTSQPMAFVKAAHRRKGYGSALIKALGKIETQYKPEEGMIGSIKFWESNGLEVRQW